MCIFNVQLFFSCSRTDVAFLQPFQTQKMRDHFNSAHLLTSRSMNHGMQNAMESLAKDKTCYGNILRYFKNGYVDFNDGKVCEVSVFTDTLCMFLQLKLHKVPHLLLPLFYCCRVSILVTVAHSLTSSRTVIVKEFKKKGWRKKKKRFNLTSQLSITVPLVSNAN